MGNREIKFRAWDEENKEMDYEPQVTEAVFRNASESVNYLIELSQKEDKNIWMQYTGLKDMRGVEIYEGDIVKNHWHDINMKDIGALWGVCFGEHLTSADYYASEAYGWYAEKINATDDERTNSLHDLAHDKDKGIEIIGNIYENPELLVDHTT